MVLQKMMIKVAMESAIQRSEALSIAVGFCGVIYLHHWMEKATLSSSVITLAAKLRKRMCYAELISVVEEKKEEKKPSNSETAKYCMQSVMLPYHSGAMQPYPYAVHQPTYDPNPCSVM